MNTELIVVLDNIMFKELLLYVHEVFHSSSIHYAFCYKTVYKINAQHLFLVNSFSYFIRECFKSNACFSLPKPLFSVKSSFHFENACNCSFIYTYLVCPFLACQIRIFEA